MANPNPNRNPNPNQVSFARALARGSSAEGATHEAMAAWVREHEPSRPVQYESCGGAPCTDIICPMYPPWRVLRAMDTVQA